MHGAGGGFPQGNVSQEAVTPVAAGWREGGCWILFYHNQLSWVFQARPLRA